MSVDERAIVAEGLPSRIESLTKYMRTLGGDRVLTRMVLLGALGFIVAVAVVVSQIAAPEEPLVIPRARTVGFASFADCFRVVQDPEGCGSIHSPKTSFGGYRQCLSVTRDALFCSKHFLIRDLAGVP
jgi:hypothetical protein